MRKIYNLILIIFVLSMTYGADAQHYAKNASDQPATYVTPSKGDEALRGVVKEGVDLRYPNRVIGHSYYDLQTNNSMQRRLAVDGNGGVAASWTMSLLENDAGFPDRGGAYNFYDGSDWGDDPEQRVEAARCGWPSINIDGDGTTIVVSHENGANLLAYSRKKAGEDTWSYNTVASATSFGVLWPRAAVGGTDNKTLHAIAITTPTGTFGGALHEEVNGHILYYRSQDGGDTWDIIDGIIPGLDKDNYAEMELDAYSIEARGNTVAVAIYGQWGDVLLFKSEDNGDTWAKTVIMDFPMDKYVSGTEYDTSDIGGIDPLGWAGRIVDYDDTQLRSIYTTDGSGTLAIDTEGNCHVAIGEMIVSYDAAAAGNVYYPGVNGIVYWNEGMGADAALPTVGQALDLDGDSTLFADNKTIATYYGSLSTFPSMVIDDTDQLFLTYSAVVETLFTDPGDEYYRHVYIITSKDGGANWTEPFDVINEEFYKGTDDEGLENETECVFPSLAVDDNKLYLLFQLDFEPGMHVPDAADRDDIGDQEMSFLIFGKDDFTLVEQVVSPSTFDMSITPNPAHEVATLNFDIEHSSIARLEVYDMNGQIMFTDHLGNLNAGSHQHKLNTSLSAGVYIVKLVVNKAASSMKLIVE